MKKFLLLSCLALPSALATVYFQESFPDADIPPYWTTSDALEEDGQSGGAWDISPGQFFDSENEEEAKGLRTTEDHRFYRISAPLTTPIPKGSSFVISYLVRVEPQIECGGLSLKFFGKNHDPKTLNAATPYILRFGPDRCGTQTRHVLLDATFSDGSTRELIKEKRRLRCLTDHVSHVYTLELSGNSYSVSIDGRVREKGSLDSERFEILNAQGNKLNAEGAGNLSVDLDEIHHVGIDVWQVRAGSIFDNIVIAETKEEAESFISHHVRENAMSNERARFEAIHVAHEKEVAEARKKYAEQIKAQEDQARARLLKEQLLEKEKLRQEEMVKNEL